MIEAENLNEKPSIESNDAEIEQSSKQDQQSAESEPQPSPKSTVVSETIDEPVEKSDSDKKNE